MKKYFDLLEIFAGMCAGTIFRIGSTCNAIKICKSLTDHLHWLIVAWASMIDHLQFREFLFLYKPNEYRISCWDTSLDFWAQISDIINFRLSGSIKYIDFLKSKRILPLKTLSIVQIYMKPHAFFCEAIKAYSISILFEIVVWRNWKISVSLTFPAKTFTANVNHFNHYIAWH